jgi:hypothetical protein
VAVSAEKDERILPDLLVIEVFFPDQNALQDRLSSLQDAVKQIRMQ